MIHCTKIQKYCEIQLRQYVPELNFRVVLVPGGICGDQFMKMNNEWPILFQIQTVHGLASHWIYVCDRVIYNSNLNINLTKSGANFESNPIADLANNATKGPSFKLKQAMHLKNC